MDEQRKSFRALLSFLVCALLLLIWGLLFLGDSFVGACLQAMVRGVLATYRQQAGSHKVYGTWLLLLLLLLVIGCFVGAFLQAMVGVVLAVYRQQAGSHKVCGTWLLVLCYYCWLFCGSLPASDDLWTTKARIASRRAPAISAASRSCIFGLLNWPPCL